MDAIEAADEAADEGPGWTLPADVLQHIMWRVSTWQVPGGTIAAPVCRSWRTAAAGCSGIRLLYHPGSSLRASSFSTWLEHNSHQLESLIIMASETKDALEVLRPLEVAGQLAAAAGRPLPLHTLRVLGHDGPSLCLTGKLLAALPNLHTLGVMVKELNPFLPRRALSTSTHNSQDTTTYIQTHLAPLKAATQLQELYLVGPHYTTACAATVAQLLPTSLRRLSWRPSSFGDPPEAVPDLSHLTRLTFLQLLGWRERTMASRRLPLGLRQLQLDRMEAPGRVLTQHKGILAGWFHPPHTATSSVQQHLLSRKFRNLRVATMTASVLQDPAVRAALGQLRRLDTLQVRQHYTASIPQLDMGWVMAAAVRLPGLRVLFVDLPGMPPAAGLAALTGLTRLTVALQDSSFRIPEQQQREWAGELGRLPGLKWLSVPGELLLVAQPWLGGLTQLRVLMLSRLLRPGYLAEDTSRWSDTFERVVQRLEGSNPPDLPPQLLLLGLTGIYAHHVASHQLYRRLRCLLGSRGCEVVGGRHLEMMGDPTQQLAGLPLALQQALNE